MNIPSFSFPVGVQPHFVPNHPVQKPGITRPQADSIRFGAGSSQPRLSVNGAEMLKAAIAELTKTDAGRAIRVEQQLNQLKQQFGQDALMVLQVAAVQKDFEDYGLPPIIAAQPTAIFKDNFSKLGFDRQHMEDLHNEFNKTGGKTKFAELMDFWEETTKYLLVHFIHGQPSTNSIDTVKGEDVLDAAIQHIAKADQKQGRILQGVWDDAKQHAGSDASLMIYMAGLHRKIKSLPINFLFKWQAWSHAQKEVAGMGFGKDKVNDVIDLYSQIGGDYKYGTLADLYFNLSEQQLAHIAKTP